MAPARRLTLSAGRLGGSRASGFSILEALIALTVTGLVATALLLALSQGRRDSLLAREWGTEEERATTLLMERLNSWESLRSDQARRSFASQTGDDTLLGRWEWRLEVSEPAEGRPISLHRVQLRWHRQEKVRTVETHAALRTSY